MKTPYIALKKCDYFLFKLSNLGDNKPENNVHTSSETWKHSLFKSKNSIELQGKMSLQYNVFVFKNAVLYEIHSKNNNDRIIMAHLCTSPKTLGFM